MDERQEPVQDSNLTDNATTEEGFRGGGQSAARSSTKHTGKDEGFQ